MVETRHPSEWLDGWPEEEPEFPLNGGWMMDHLFWALWYNGCDEQVEKLADMMRDASGQVTRSDTSFDDDGVELLWMMLVSRMYFQTRSGMSKKLIVGELLMYFRIQQ